MALGEATVGLKPTALVCSSHVDTLPDPKVVASLTLQWQAGSLEGLTQLV